MNGEEDLLFKWATIARAMNVSERTLKRWCATARVKLPHWEDKLNGPVWIPKATLGVLWMRLVRIQKGVKAVKNRRLMIAYATLQNEKTIHSPSAPSKPPHSPSLSPPTHFLQSKFPRDE